VAELLQTVLALHMVEFLVRIPALIAGMAVKNANQVNTKVKEIHLLLMLSFKWHPKLSKASKQNQVRLFLETLFLHSSKVIF
jgi:hypothetical protein